jgi:undecaprenyl-diphosphatase
MTPVESWTTPSALARERTVLIGVLMIATVAFGVLTAVAVGSRAGTPFDKAVAAWLFDATDGSTLLSAVARILDVVGGNLVSFVIVLAATGVLASRRHGYLAGYAFVSALGGVLLSTAVKSLVDRPRPLTVGTLIDETTSSFPSGHATSSVTTFGALAVVCVVALRPGVRAWAAGVFVLLGLAISVSRVAVGVHWPTDVMGGWALGTAWTSAVALTVVLMVTWKASRLTVAGVAAPRGYAG